MIPPAEIVDVAFVQKVALSLVEKVEVPPRAAFVVQFVEVVSHAPVLVAQKRLWENWETRSSRAVPVFVKVYFVLEAVVMELLSARVPKPSEEPSKAILLFPEIAVVEEIRMFVAAELDPPAVQDPEREM